MTSRAISLLLTLLAAVGLTFAVSTKPITLQSGTPVPAKRIYRTELTTPSPGHTAKVSFLRDDGTLGGACNHKILVDGSAAFEIRPGEYQTVYLAPGTHLFRLEIGGEGGFCKTFSTSQSTVLDDGAEVSFRISIPSIASPPRFTKLSGSTEGSVAVLPQPAFKWNSQYSTPGTSLTVKEKARVKSSRGTRVEYELTAVGFSSEAPSILWWKQGGSYSQLKTTIGENGNVAILGTQSFMIEDHVPGQAVDLALVSGDNRAQANTIPFPISANEGGYRASVEIMSGTGLIFEVTFGGFQPGEAVNVSSEYKGERLAKTVNASASGEVVFPVAFGPKDQGSATAVATGSNGSVSIQYKVGKKALVTQ